MVRKLLVAFAGAFIVAAAAFVLAWRHDRRLGSGPVNRLVNPLLIREGLTGGAHSEIGTLEHVGRVTGEVRVTPVRPVPTPDGFRIVVPLATESQWARNVLAAGHCRLQYRGSVYELDEPQLVEARDCQDLSAPVRLLASAFDFRYMRLHQFGVRPGTLSAAPVDHVRRDEVVVSDIDLVPAGR